MKVPLAGLPRAASVVIVGAGIIGLSLAFELARRSVDVLVLERSYVASGAAGVAAGMLAPAGEAEHESSDLVRLAQESWRLYPGFIESVEQVSGIACGYSREGTLLVALTRDDEHELISLKRFQERLGLATAWLNPAEIHEMEPHLSPRITGALFAADDHQVDPRALLSGLEQAATVYGGRVVTNARVTGFETRSGHLFQVVGRLGPGSPVGRGESKAGANETTSAVADGEAFTVRCELAVLAAGAWSGRDLAWPAAPLGVRPVKGQLVRLHGAKLLRHVIRTPRAYLVPRHGGELVVGATMEEQGFDPAPTAGAVMDLLWNARLAVPAVYDLQLSEVNVGFRPATRDHLPLIGETEVPGLYVATGHFRHGVLLAPATAAFLADLIMEGRVAPVLAPFRPSRTRGADSVAPVIESAETRGGRG